jgi:hypothetical protein
MLYDEHGRTKIRLHVLQTEHRELARTVDDHEQRLRAADRVRYALPMSVICATLTSLASITLALLG